MTTWGDARQAIFDTIVLCSELPKEHVQWEDGRRSWLKEPTFFISIQRSRSIHDRIVRTPNPNGSKESLSTMTEIIVHVTAESITATHSQGEPGRMLALDALEHLRMGSSRDDVRASLRAKRLCWYDDHGISYVPRQDPDNRTISAYHVDLLWRGEIFYEPRSPNIGVIEHVEFEGDLDDGSGGDPDVEIADTVDRPPDP